MEFTMENLQASELGNLKWEKAAITSRDRGLKKANGGRTGGTGPSKLQAQKKERFMSCTMGLLVAKSHSAVRSMMKAYNLLEEL
jgi:hypothetical protein